MLSGIKINKLIEEVLFAKQQQCQAERTDRQIWPSGKHRERRLREFGHRGSIAEDRNMPLNEVGLCGATGCVRPARSYSAHLPKLRFREQKVMAIASR